MTGIDKVSEIIEEISPYYSKIKNKKGKIKRDVVPAEEHKLVYDSTSETLEPVYFWILDMMNGLFSGKVEKIIDNFSSSPGSGHFAELGARATRMQEEGMKILGAVNTVLKSIINLIYDLKEFEIRLEHYKASHDKDKEKSEAGMLALKQIWMDNVDVKRGRGSINMLTYDMNFVTLRDAFMIVKSLEDVEKMDLNDRVKRILKPRLAEFLEWKKRSETELRKRFEIEKSYLKSQVNSLQLYTRWAKPYLIAAEKLSQKESGKEPALVNAFNTIMLELAMLGKKEINIEEEAVDKNLPEEFRKLKVKRPYYSCVLVDFVFRGIPQRISQQAHYVFGGRVEVTFRGYCLNEDELAVLEEKLKEADIEDGLKLVEGLTTESLGELKEDLDKYLKSEEEKSEEEYEKAKEQDVNPFSALFGFGKRKPKTEKGKTKEEQEKNKKKAKTEKLKEKGVPSDSYVEGVIRTLGEQTTAKTCFDIFDIYKKAHGMPSHPSPFD